VAAVVSVQSVTKRFPGIAAVDGVSLDIEDGQFVTLLGPSGCGKTTLLRLIAGFETPDEGRIFFGATDVTDEPPHSRDVHTVFQQYALFPHLSVADNVAFGLRRGRERRSRDEIARRVGEALELVQLTGFESRMPSQLSGGQQQRVAIARAVAPGPRILLLDEPLGALDRKLREAMQLELKQLQRRLGISFVFVTHDQDEALAMSDVVVVMKEGRIEQMDAPAVIYEHPRTRFIAEFVGVTNVIEGYVEGIDGATARIRTPAGVVPLSALANGGPALATGDRVTVAVRPEKIRFAGSKDAGAIACRVEDARYLGDVTHWRVRLIDGSTWTVFAQNDGTPDALAPGAEVGLVWETDHGVRLES